MPVTPEYRDFVLDQLGRVVPIAGRSMFGGVGLYSDGLFFGLLDDDRLYLKVDDSSRVDFERLGMEPFRPFGEGSRPMQYYELPGHLLEDARELRPWLESSLQVARAATRRKRKK